MNHTPSQGALGSYRANGATLAVDHADPHQLIAMLMERALSRLAIARGHMQRHDDQAKAEQISGTMAIIAGLQSFLDHGQGKLAGDLDALYDYMERRLVRANMDNDLAALEEVTALLRELHGGWKGIEGRATDATAPLSA